MTIPSEILAQFKAYVSDGICPGDLVRAILENNFVHAVRDSDATTLPILAEIVNYCQNHVPDTCWGNPDAVERWIKFKAQQRNMRNLVKGACHERAH
jgi:hypothetical protein